MKRVLFTGGRDFDDEILLRQALSALDPDQHIIIHGAASGLDSLAGRVGVQLGFQVESYPAKWYKCDSTGESGVRCYHKPRPTNYCPAAGPRRNQYMLNTGIDLVYAFPGGNGTADMKRRARKSGIRVVEWEERYE